MTFFFKKINHETLFLIKFIYLTDNYTSIKYLSFQKKNLQLFNYLIKSIFYLFTMQIMKIFFDNQKVFLIFSVKI